MRYIALTVLAFAACGTEGVPGEAGPPGPAGGPGSVSIADATGKIIGAMTAVADKQIQIWDWDRELLFWLNTETGYVVGRQRPEVYYALSSCQGAAYYACEAVPWLAVGDDNDRDGQTQASGTFRLQPVDIESRSVDIGTCEAYSGEECYAESVPTDLPTAFELPLTLE